MEELHHIHSGMHELVVGVDDLLYGTLRDMLAGDQDDHHNSERCPHRAAGARPNCGSDDLLQHHGPGCRRARVP